MSEQGEKAKTFFELAGVRFNANVDEIRLGDDAGTELAVVSAADFRWSQVVAEDRPTVEDDYYGSDENFSQRDMLGRWSDLDKYEEIKLLFAVPFLERQAERVRRRLELVGGGLDVMDVGYDTYFTNRSALLLDGLFEEEVQLLLSGKVPDRRKVLNSLGGYRSEEYYREATAKDRSIHIKNLEILMKLSNLAKGKATQILENRSGVGSSMEELRLRVREVMSEMPVVAITGAVGFALPEGAVENAITEVEGEIMEDVENVEY